MTVMEFYGCAFLAFGPPFAMFLFTIAPDPVRIIILIAAAFFWLLSLLLSSLLWFALYTLREYIYIAATFSILCQEIFRLIIYTILRRAENGLMKITDDHATLIDNKHILAYVSGLGFGIISGAIALANVLADAIGPGTMGLQVGNELFFLTSSATALCFILLHTFWSVIFFNGWDNGDKLQISYVFVTHFIAFSITALNKYQIYAATLVPLYSLLLVTAIYAFRVAGGSYGSLKAAFSLI